MIKTLIEILKSRARGHLPIVFALFAVFILVVFYAAFTRVKSSSVENSRPDDTAFSIEGEIKQINKRSGKTEFKSEPHGFSMEYPSDWKVIAEADPKDDGLLAISPTGAIGIPAFAIYANSTANRNFISNYIRNNSTKTLVDGIDAYRFKQSFGDQGAQLLVEFERGTFTYTFHMFYSNPDFENLFDEMVSSVKFSN